MTELPPAVDPNLAPGGIVFRLYDADGRMLSERLAPASLPLSDLNHVALSDGTAAARAIEEGAVMPLVLCCYDGDDGELLSAIAAMEVPE